MENIFTGKCTTPLHFVLIDCVVGDSGMLVYGTASILTFDWNTVLTVAVVYRYLKLCSG
jgi:hypothetical protein